MGLNNAVGGRLHKHQTMAIRALERTTWAVSKHGGLLHVKQQTAFNK